VGFPLSVTCPAEEFFSSVDRVTDELITLEGCSRGLLDSTVSADRDACLAEFELTVAAGSPGEALDRALGFVRTAIHAAGDGTPGWEEFWSHIHDELRTRQITPALC